LPFKSQNDEENLSSTRKSVMQVYETRKTIFGYEKENANFGLRIISPIIYKEKYLGSVENTIDINEIISSIQMFDNEKVYIYSIRNDSTVKDSSVFQLEESLKSDSISAVPENVLNTGKDTFTYQIIDNKLIIAFPVKDFENKGVGVVCYVHDFSNIISASYADMNRLIIVLTIIFLVFIIILSGALIWLVSTPLKKLIKDLEPFKKGDFTHSINISRKDEIGQLASALNDTFMKMKELIGSVQGTVDNLNQAGEHINSSAQDVSQGASEQAASVEQVSASMEQMTANVEQNMHNSQITEKNVLMAAAAVFEGNKSVKRTADLMRNILEKVNVINDIAKQTNILALNASVEAASAGEFGKGFAVIAREIRELAEYSRRAAVEITDNVKQGSAISDKATKQLGEIVKQMETTSELIKQITIASQEQNNGIEQITNGIQQLNKVTQQNAAVSEEMATNSEELAGQAEMLKNVVQYFKLGNFIPMVKDEFKTVSDNHNDDFNFVPDNQIADLSQYTQISKIKKEKGINLDLGEISDNDFERF
jgi:methyl-accepting chemotaxis protein